MGGQFATMDPSDSALAFALAVISAISTISISALNSLRQENLDKIASQASEKAKVLKKLKDSFEEGESALHFIEFLLYLFVAVLFFNAAFKFGAVEKWVSLFLLAAIAFPVRQFFAALGKRYSQSISSAFYPAIRIAAFFAIPFLRVEKFLRGAVAKEDAEEETREELNAMFETAKEEGALDLEEYNLLKNVMRFSEVLVSDVMTPRTMAFFLDADLTVEEALKEPELKRFSRVPLTNGKTLDDEPVGYATTKDVFSAALDGGAKRKLKEFAREIHFIPESVSLDKALDMFLRKMRHIALVVDEYGGVEGIITLEDVLETMLGAEIVDEADEYVDLRAAAKEKRDKRIAAIRQTNSAN